MTDPDGTHVDKEAATVQFAPTVVKSFEGITAPVKIVGASDDHDAVRRAESAARERFGDELSARAGRSRTTWTSPIPTPTRAEP